MKRALRTTVAIAALMVALVVGTGSVASPAGAQELDLCALLGDPYCPPLGGTVVAGGTLTIEGEGCRPGETVKVTLLSPLTDLGSFIADAAGKVTATVTIPAGAEPGRHTITIVGLTSGCRTERSVQVLSAGVTRGGAGGLARTGSDTGPLVGIGAGLVAAGGAAAYAARRRAATASYLA